MKNEFLNEELEVQDVSIVEINIPPRLNVRIEIDIDIMFWALLPAVNLNLHSKGFEFEWLCIGIYISKSK